MRLERVRVRLQPESEPWERERHQASAWILLLCVAMGWLALAFALLD